MPSLIGLRVTATVRTNGISVFNAPKNVLSISSSMPASAGPNLAHNAPQFRHPLPPTVRDIRH